MSVVIAFLIVGILGLVLGLGLAVAEKKLAVEKDPKLEELEASMPGANCGGCGFAGCQAYAEAVYNGTAPAGLCSPGGEALARKMGEILGVEGAKQTSDLVGAMQDASVAYGERIAAGVNAEGLKSLHESYIVNSQLYGYIRTALLAGIDDFASNARSLAEIGILNLKITFSRDNPSAVLTDYWSVTERFDEAYFSDEFRALTDEMEALLTDYAENFGADITSKDEFYDELYDFAVLAGKEFEDLVFSLASSAIESITDPQAIFEAFEEFAAIDFGKILENLTPQTILSSLSEYRGILARSGIDPNLTETLSHVPTTVAEYISEMRSVVTAIYETRTEIFRERYDRVRDALTDEEYSAFVDGIAREYGSTENFWENCVGVQ